MVAVGVVEAVLAGVHPLVLDQDDALPGGVEVDQVSPQGLLGDFAVGIGDVKPLAEPSELAPGGVRRHVRQPADHRAGIMIDLLVLTRPGDPAEVRRRDRVIGERPARAIPLGKHRAKHPRHPDRADGCVALHRHRLACQGVADGILPGDALDPLDNFPQVGPDLDQRAYQGLPRSFGHRPLVHQVLVESLGNQVHNIAVLHRRRDLLDAGDLQHQVKVCR
jgi:hypothetical protein